MGFAGKAKSFCKPVASVSLACGAHSLSLSLSLSLARSLLLSLSLARARARARALSLSQDPSKSPRDPDHPGRRRQSPMYTTDKAWEESVPVSAAARGREVCVLNVF